MLNVEVGLHILSADCSLVKVYSDEIKARYNGCCISLNASLLCNNNFMCVGYVNLVHIQLSYFLGDRL